MPLNSLTRRSFLAAAAAPLLAQQDDPFRGLGPERFAPTGAFRLEKTDRWRFVTPDGKPYLSFSLNHASVGSVSQAYNREHWVRAFGARSMEDPAFRDGFRKRVREDLRVFGFNSLGCHSPRAGWAPSFAPYVMPFKTVFTDHWLTPKDADFPDVFDDSFEEHCERRAIELGLPERANDPFLLGYMFTDCPILTELDAAARPVRIFGAPRAGTSTWPRRLRNLGSDAAGKRAFVALMRQRYANDVAGFNRVYRLALSSFDGLEAARNWRPAAEPDNALEARDNEAFLRLIIERYYQVMIRVIRRHDSKHLIFGDKLNGNTDTPDWVIKTIAPFVDAIFYQWYGFYGEQHAQLNRWAEIAGKPLFNGDGAFSSPHAMMPNPLGPHLPTQEDCAAAALEYGRRVFEREDFVGWSWCGWVETWKTMPGKESRQHSGVIGAKGRRYEPMVRALRRLSGELAQFAA